ncbi:Dynein heavy chain domain-containing protein 1 [Oryzias melastigma]|uniref:Dynein heavy chain domain-containing protein 1 n=1 Tax=Oryzias melastigma TaxID=30732 RepID=A0A834F3T3_ORYME|nr:Dynein heavy chain domain-containing protein 1 [Oryzias melastigma]
MFLSLCCPAGFPLKSIHSSSVLEQISSFRGLVASLCASPMQWKEYLRFPSSTVVGTVPCRSHSHLSLLQRLLLWNTIVPNCLEGLASTLEECLLCLPDPAGLTDTPHTGNPQALARYLVNHEGPIIISLPNPKGDKTATIQPLSLISQLSRWVGGENKVHLTVIYSGTMPEEEAVLSLLDTAVNEGHWIIFYCCHLVERWDDKLVERMSQLMSSSEEGKCVTHPCFRLWFVTHETEKCSIPAVVRMRAFLLACDSPWDLNEELSCSTRHLLSFCQAQSSSDVSAENMELFIRCIIFHSVLLQRQRCKYLGFGKACHWNQEDLFVLVDASMSIASLCYDKTKVLQHTAITLVHGGHVVDSADLNAVECVARCCFGAESFAGNGPHILWDIVNTHGDLDLSGVLQTLDQYFGNSTNSDSDMLGFSSDVASEVTKINSYNLHSLLQASQTPPGLLGSCIVRNQRAKLPDYRLTRDRLQALRNYLTQRREVNVEGVSRSPIRDFLQTEWNALSDSVSALASQLQLSSFSLLHLIDLPCLEKKAVLLSSYLWQEGTTDPPGAYRLSAFKKPRGFLAALIREGALVNHKYISDMVLHFQERRQDGNEELNDDEIITKVPLHTEFSPVLCSLRTVRLVTWTGITMKPSRNLATTLSCCILTTAGLYLVDFSCVSRIRRSTWLRLRLLSLPQYHISDVMRASLSTDPLHKVAPLLAEPHLAALSRRLKTVLDTVSRCQEQQKEDGREKVIYDDLDSLRNSTFFAGL